MDDSPPPAYTEDDKRSVAPNTPRAIPLTPLDGSKPQNPSKWSQGRDFPRPLPRPPGGESPTVSPLRVHKKSQSTVIPVRPWKPPSLDGGASDRWDPPASNPQFRHREAEFPSSESTLPFSAHKKYLGRPPIPFAQSGGHFQTPLADADQRIGVKRVATLHAQQPATAQVDPNSFYSPAVSGYLARPPPRKTDSHPHPDQPSHHPPSGGRHVRWGP